MELIDLTLLATEHLEAARTSPNGRSSTKIVGDHTALLRSNLIALAEGAVLQDHESPGEATLTVLVGSIKFHALGESVTLTEGQMLVIPAARHGLSALSDSVVVLTVAKA